MEILELILLTNNLEETEKFYSTLLEFKLIDKTKKSLTYSTGKSKLTFQSAEKNTQPYYHFAFTIPKNKMDEAIVWCKKRVELIKDYDGNELIIFDNWNAESIYFYDNNHNILEFICRKDLPNESMELFSSQSIENISEAGIVADEPLKFGEELRQKTKLDYYVKGPKREDFAAMGTNTGLFVISNSERNWFPTNRKAEKYPIKVKIQVEGEVFELFFD